MNWSEQHMNCNYMKLVLLSTLFYLLISNQVDAGEFDNIKVDVLAKSGFSWDGSHLPIPLLYLNGMFFCLMT